MHSILNRLGALSGKQVHIRFAQGSITGRLEAVIADATGYVLHLTSAAGDHYIAFPGQVQHVLVPRNE